MTIPLTSWKFHDIEFRIIAGKIHSAMKGKRFTQQPKTKTKETK